MGQRVVVVAVVVTAAGFASALAGASVARQDRFTARPVSGSGRYGRMTGKLRLALEVRASSAGTRSVILGVRGSLCRPRCAAVSGKLKGTLRRELSNPDIGQSLTLIVKGRLVPFGHLDARGSMHGTGFIARGHETLQLTFAARHGKFTITGESPQVPGFTSP